jgi:hypothetical protein
MRCPYYLKCYHCSAEAYTLARSVQFSTVPTTTKHEALILKPLIFLFFTVIKSKKKKVTTKIMLYCKKPQTQTEQRKGK